ncbi:GAF domain-containing protein [Halorussus halophilus]|uniref:GAF domain-containing protein n=1 Tax=Halorussus halophilus TaxID=2650975 RepID=UPI001300D6EE|nr:GAF domain-containing protein [Halorussus halophilus]
MLEQSGRRGASSGESLRAVYVGCEDRAKALDAYSSTLHVSSERTGAGVLSRIEAAEDDEVHCIVAESDVPDTTGAELLDAVGELYPETARLYVGDSVESSPEGAAFVATDADDFAARLAERIENTVERRRVERQRNRFAEQLRTLVDGSPDAIVTIDAEGEIVFANATTEQVFGRDPTSLVGTSFRTLLQPRMHEPLEAKLRELREEPELVERDYVELKGRHRDGHEIPLAISFRESVRDGDHYFSGIIRDESQRKRLEDRLAEEKRKTQELHEVAVMLEACETTDEVYELTVETAEQLLEFDLCAVDSEDDGELVPQAVSKGVPTDGYYTTTNVDADDKLAARAYRLGETIRTADLHEAGVVPAESGYRSALSVPIGDVGVLQAVSQEVGAFDESDRELAELLVAHVAEALERIHSEAALQAERDRFAGLFENIRDSIIDYEMRDGELIFRSVNEAFEEVFGYDAEEVVGESMVEHLVPEDQKEKAREHVERMKRGDHVNAEVRRKTADGERVFLLRTAELPGEHSGGYVMYTDITERKQLERDVEHQKQKIEDLHHVAVKLESCDTLEAIYRQTVDAAEEILKFDICGLDEAEGDYLVPKATSSGLVVEDYNVLRTDEGLAGKTYQTGESYVIDDATELTDVELANEKYRSLLSVPVGDRGVFQAGSRSASEFDEDDLKMAELLVSHTSEALKRVESETALREERDRFAGLFENIPEPTIDYQIQGDEPKLRNVNEAFEEVFGYDGDEIRGENVDDLIVPDEDRGEAEQLNEQVKAGARIDAEVTREGPDCTREFLLRNARVSGEDYGGYTIYTDITERKERERMLDALHGATRELMAAEREYEIGETSVETARTVLDQPHASVFRWNEDEAQLEPFVTTDETAESIGSAPTFEKGEGVVGSAFADGEVVVHENAQEAENALEDGSPAIRGFCVLPLGDWGAITVASLTTEAFDEYEIDLLRVLAANTEVALERAAREAELADQREQLAELDRINEVIRDIDQLLVRTSTRDEMEQAICDRLAASEEYRFAWLGSKRGASGSGRIEPTASAGDGDDYLAETAAMQEETPDGPVELAYETGEVQVIENVESDPDFEPWREQALEKGYQSEVVIPLRYRETVYGVLCVYADRRNAFDTRETAVLAELGETIGHAINAIENRKALLSDGVVELTLETGGGDDFFVRLPREKECQFSLEGVTLGPGE